MTIVECGLLLSADYDREDFEILPHWSITQAMMILKIAELSL